MQAETKRLIKVHLNQIRDALFYGAFAMLLPGIFFVGLAISVIVLLGLQDTISMTIVYAYGAACAGVWVGIRITKERIRKMHYTNTSREELLDSLD